MSSGDLSRTLVYLVKVVLPFCANNFGVAPCTATGTPCWNTKATCKDLANYAKVDKVYSYSSADAPVPFPGPRPYLKQFTPLAPEIKDELTVSGRIKLSFYDEPDGDVGIDPYVVQRPLFPKIPGTYWRKLVSRNPRYKGAPVTVLQGEVTDPVEAFTPCGAGILDTISFGTDGTVTIDVLDQLQALRFCDIPPTLNIKLATDLTETGTSCFLIGNTYADNQDIAQLPGSGYAKIDDEIIYYTAIDSTTWKMTIDARAAFGTIAASHSNGATVQAVKHYPPANPFDTMKSMLLDDAGYAPENVDSAAFDAARDWYPYDIPVSAVITDPVEARTLFLELVGLFGCRAWVDEQARITITRIVPNESGRVYPLLSDAANLVSQTQQLDMGDASSNGTVVNYGSGVVLYWDKKIVDSSSGTSSASDTDPTGYNTVTSYVDPDLFDAFAEQMEDQASQSGLATVGLQLKKVYCRWISRGHLSDEDLDNGVNDLVWRMFREVTQPHPVITTDVMIQDMDRKVGEIVDVVTRQLCNPDGTDATVRSLIIRKEPKGAVISLKFQRVNTRRYMVCAPEELAGLDWSEASEEQRQYGFLASENGLLPDGSQGFYLW
jgi:hypothetical protein